MSNPISNTDEELIAQYRQSGDNKILGTLLQRYTLLLFGVAMKYLKDKTQAEDAVQQIFLKTLTRFPEGEVANFKGWLYVLMRNHCLQQLKGRTFHEAEERLRTVAGDEPGLMEELRWKDQKLDEMDSALMQLNEEQRTCVELFYLKGQSYQQIMERTGFNFMQVKSFIQNGKRNLKIILSKKQ